MKKAKLFLKDWDLLEEGMLRDNELLNGIYSSSYIYSLLKSEYNSK